MPGSCTQITWDEYFPSLSPVESLVGWQLNVCLDKCRLCQKGGDPSRLQKLRQFSCGRSLVFDAAGPEGPATGPETTFKASTLPRTLPVVPEISAPTTTQEILGSVVELGLSFLILRLLVGDYQTLGRGDLVDAVLRIAVVEG